MAFEIKTHCCISVNVLAVLSLLFRNFREGNHLCGCMPNNTQQVCFFSKVSFVYNKTFEWNAKSQTRGWIVCLVSPSAAVKIKGNNQQIT